MSKTLQFSVFTNLRLASAKFTPAHSKNGANVSQRLAINAYMNENRRGSAEDKSKAISLTAWGNGADILAWCLTPGKEFTIFGDLNVYDAPVYFNNQPVSMGGQVLMRKCYGYTIRRFDLGNDSFKHIMDEIQRGVRGVNWWVKGSQDAINFKTILDARMAEAKKGFNIQSGASHWGFIEVELPRYQYGAYNPNAPVNTNTMPTATPMSAGSAPTAETVAASFGAVPQAAPVQPAAPTNPAQSFVMPQSAGAPVQPQVQTAAPNLGIPSGV